jgi:hypothetical protein
MAYVLWGGSPADFTYNPSTGVPVGAVSLEAWNDQHSGSRLTDLKLYDGDGVEGSAAASGYFPSAGDGTVRIWVPDTVTQVWIREQGGSGARWCLSPARLPERVAAVEAGDYVERGEVGAPLGIAPLDGAGLVPEANLPGSFATGVSSITTPVGGTEAGAVSLSAADLGAIDQTAADVRYPLRAEVAAVALSGSYQDLLNKPTIPTTAAGVGAIPATDKGAVSGVATLSVAGKHTSTEIPFGTTANTVMSGNAIILAANMANSSVMFALYTGGAYPARPTTRTTVMVFWVGPVAPGIGGTGAVNNVDQWINTAP